MSNGAEGTEYEWHAPHQRYNKNVAKITYKFGVYRKTQEVQCFTGNLFPPKIPDCYFEMLPNVCDNCNNTRLLGAALYKFSETYMTYVISGIQNPETELGSTRLS